MSVFHLKRPRKKHEENSIRGVHEAKRRGDDEIDIDLLMDLLGFIYGCHWPFPMLRDGFHDLIFPRRKRMPARTNIKRMTPEQVGRLVAFTRGRVYRIRRIERLLRECARVGIGAVLEPKGDPRFNQDAPWQHLAKVCDDLGVHARVYALSENSAALAPAKRAGFNVKEIR